MAMYCEICGEELESKGEAEGICENCKLAKEEEPPYEKDENYIDPGIT